MNRVATIGLTLALAATTVSLATSPDGDAGADLSKKYGAVRSNSTSDTAMQIYVVPMNGAMGLDCNLQVYKDMFDDIREKAPDRIVVIMDCADAKMSLNEGRIEVSDVSGDGSGFLDMYREMASFFHDDLGDIPQTLWIHDSNGISSIMALSWKDIYMKPEARLAGLAEQGKFFAYLAGDQNIFGKYREAYMGWLRGLAEYGDNDTVLVDAMVLPEVQLSANWLGREIEWMQDGIGEIVVDPSAEATVGFRAEIAEDLLICDGLADTFDDLAILLGTREYNIINDAKAEAIFEKYKEDWRRVYEGAMANFRSYQEARSWATGEDTVKYLGRAKTLLKKILGAIKRYDAVAYRVGSETGLDETRIQILIEQINEQIAAIRRGERGGRGGSSGGALGGGGGTRR